MCFQLRFFSKRKRRRHFIVCLSFNQRTDSDVGLYCKTFGVPGTLRLSTKSPPPPPTHTHTPPLIPKSKGLSGFFSHKRTDVLLWTAESKSTILSTNVKTKIISVDGCVRDLWNAIFILCQLQNHTIYIKAKDTALFCVFRLLHCVHTHGFLMQMERNFC